MDKFEKRFALYMASGMAGSMTLMYAVMGATLLALPLGLFGVAMLIVAYHYLRLMFPKLLRRRV